MAHTSYSHSTTTAQRKDTEELLKASKKKRKHCDHEEETVVTETDTAKPHKKRKRRRSHSTEDGNNDSSGEATESAELPMGALAGDGELLRKKKKKRSKHGHVVIDGATTESDATTATQIVLEIDTPQRKKKKRAPSSEGGTVKDADVDAAASDKPKKKRRHHVEEQTPAQSVIEDAIIPTASLEAPADVPAIDPALLADVEKPRKKKKCSHPEPPIIAPFNSQHSSQNAPVITNALSPHIPVPSTSSFADSMIGLDPAATQLMAGALLSALVAASNGEQSAAGPSTFPPIPFPFPMSPDPQAFMHMPPPDQESNEMVLKALQDLDLSKLTNVLKSLEEAASAANVPLPFPPGIHPTLVHSLVPTPVNQVPPSARSILSSGFQAQPTTSQGYTSNDHAYLLAYKWLSTSQLADLVKTQGLVYKKGKFSAVEEQQLNGAIEQFRINKGLSDEQLLDVIFPKDEKNKDNAFWFEITTAVPQRPIIAVYHHVRRSRHPLRLQGKWSPAEDDKLRKAVMAHGQQWQRVSLDVGRGGMDCRDRYRNHIVNRDIRVTGHWSEEEEAKLTRIVTSMTVDKGRDADNDVFWSVVAQKMGGTRTRAQCRIKWTDSLNLSRKNDGAKPRWGNQDAYVLVHKLDALQIQDDSEIDWKTIPDPDWNIWSAHVLQVRWQTMKKSIKGHEYMSFREIMDILKVKKIEAEPSASSKKRGGNRKVTSATAVIDSAQDT